MQLYNCTTQSTMSLKNAVFIGRQFNTIEHFGNPFSHVKSTSVKTIHVPTREEAVLSFELWIEGEAFQEVEPERREWILKNLSTLRGKSLVCYCFPLPCHGTILMRMANS